MADSVATSTPTPSKLVSLSPSTTATMSQTATVLSSCHLPSPVSWGYPHLGVIALSGNPSSVFWKWRILSSSRSEAWNLNGGSLKAVGGAITSIENEVATTTRGAENVDIVVVGIDSACYYKGYKTSEVWQPVRLDTWDQRRGGLTSSLIVASWNRNRLGVFIIGEGPACWRF